MPSARASSSYSLRVRPTVAESSPSPSPSPPRRLPRVSKFVEMLPSSQSSLSSLPPSQDMTTGGDRVLSKKNLISKQRDRLHMRNRHIKRMALSGIPVASIARTWQISEWTVRSVLRQRFTTGTSWGPRRRGRSLTAATEAATQNMLREVERDPIQSLRR